MQYTITLTPQRDTLDARLLSQLVAVWLEHIGRKSSDLTLRTYGWQVSRVLRWLDDQGDAIGHQLNRDTLLNLAHWLSIQHGYHAQHDALRRLRQCLRWAYQEGFVPVDCSAWVPSAVGDPPPMRKRVTLGDLHRLLDAASTTETGVRDYALLSVLIGTGMRRAECALLDVQDVELDANGSGAIAIHHAKRVRGRTVQARMVAVDVWTGNKLRPWLDLRQPRGPLWVRLAWDKSGYNEERLGIDRITRIVQSAASAANLGGSISGPHDLRRAFASYFARRYRGNALAAGILSRQLGHATFDMTDQYILDDIDDLRDVVRSPLA